MASRSYTIPTRTAKVPASKPGQYGASTESMAQEHGTKRAKSSTPSNSRPGPSPEFMAQVLGMKHVFSTTSVNLQTETGHCNF
jgi:hypothetical protein